MGTIEKRISRLAALVVAAPILASCAGTLGGNIHTVPQVTIKWPDQSRAINAPSYASTAVITLTTPSGQTIATWNVNRPSNGPGQTVTYKGPETKVSGSAVLGISFLSSPTSTIEVASIHTDVVLRSDGTLAGPDNHDLGTVTYASNLTNLVPKGMSVGTGESATASFYGIAQDTVVALLQSLGTMKVTSGQDKVQVNGLQVTGLAEGNVTAEFRYENYTNTANIYVSPPKVTPNICPCQSYGLAWDESRKMLWATAYGAIQGINSTTNQVDKAFQNYTGASLITIAPGGAFAYASSRNTLEKVDLETGEILQTYIVPSQYATGIYKIEVNPTDPDQFVVIALEGNRPVGPYLWKSGAWVPTAIWRDITACPWMSATSFDAYADMFLVHYSVNGNSVTSDSGIPFRSRGGGSTWFLNNKIFTSTFGKVTSLPGAELAGRISFFYNDALSEFVDVTANPAGTILWEVTRLNKDDAGYYFIVRAFNPVDYTHIRSFRVYVNDQTEEVAQIRAYGDSGVAVSTGGLTYLLPNLPVH